MLPEEPQAEVAEAPEPIQETEGNEPAEADPSKDLEIERKERLRCLASAAAGGPSKDKPLMPQASYDALKEDAQDPFWFERTQTRKLATPCRAA